MSSHSHVTRLQMMDRTKGGGGHAARYAPVAASQGTPSIISGDYSIDYNAGGSSLISGMSTKTPKPKDLKLYNQKAKSQEHLNTESVLSEEGSRYGGGSYAPSFRSVNMGPRVNSKMSLVSMSKSLGASKASLASQKSTIQQEYHDLKVRKKINSPWFGAARKPFFISIAMYVLAFLLLFAGLLILFLRGFMNIFLSMDVGDVIGPLCVAFAIIAIAIGIKFSLDAYRLSSKERLKIKFRGDNINMVDITSSAAPRRPNERLMTGTSTKNAISRQLMTSSRSELAAAV